MFVDEVVIHAIAGKGGNGVVHFRREKYVPRGGPDGGDGGYGGNVIFCVDTHTNTLSDYRHKKDFRAKDGKRGGKQNQTGATGEDIILYVPPGTLVYDQDTGELVGDLIEPEQTLVVCKGGRGGRGNVRFKSSRNKVPRIAEKGEPPEERNLRLELKLIADIGIVGVPNAGKSTLLSVITNAKPKIAAYPFTTIQPNLGIAELDIETRLVLADIPGLIEGAHTGIGLGHAFLRHIQRTRVLIHLLDGLSAEPIIDLAQINTELSLFDPLLAEKPQIIVFNKMDLPSVQERWPQIQDDLKERGYNDVYAISAVANRDIRPVLYRASQLLAETPDLKTVKTDAENDLMPVYRLDADPTAFEITETPKGWRITGKSLERAALMTYWEHYQSVRRFQSIMEAMGVDEAMRKAGVEVGDTILIGDYELTWEE
ncbi:MAG: GTPase ObgE [Chloroflexota bacterium]|nr:GTPase ObgE [Chloroflexota bacterium]